MSNYGVNGWSGGVRQSLTYNLKAGQMRGMGRVNVFPSNTTVINNNIFGNSCGMYDNCCDGSDGMSGFTKTMLGIGMGTSILGTILGFFGIGGGGGKSEGAGGTETPKETKEVKASNEKQDEFAGLKVLYPDGKFAKIGDKYRCNIGDQSFEADSIVDLDKQLKAGLNKKPETVKTETDASSVKPSEPETQELQDGKITFAIDEALGSRSKIKGEVTNNTDGTVSIRGTNNTYTYEKGNKTVTYNGKSYTVYSLKGATNNKTGKAVPTTKQEYILINGQLVQPKDCKELAGLGTGSIDKSAPPPTKHRR
ncbi:unknown [Clostridium sp. CAG:715]|nr:unknown [Clostridium sp. CAG:715]